MTYENQMRDLEKQLYMIDNRLNNVSGVVDSKEAKLMDILIKERLVIEDKIALILQNCKHSVAEDFEVKAENWLKEVPANA